MVGKGTWKAGVEALEHRIAQIESRLLWMTLAAQRWEVERLKDKRRSVANLAKKSKATTPSELREMVLLHLGALHELLNARKNSAMKDNIEQVVRDMDILKLRDVMELFRVSKGTVYSWLREGEIQGTQIGGTWYFRKDLLMEKFEEREDAL